MSKLRPRPERVLLVVGLALAIAHTSTLPATAGIDGEIVYARSDNGGSFDHVANLSEDRPESLLPRVGASDGQVQVVWKSKAKDEQIFGRRSGDQGGGFAGTVEHSPGGQDSSEPDVAVTSGRTVVVYSTENNGADEVFALLSSDGGQSFSKPVNVSRSKTASKDPDLALTSAFAVVAFEEEVIDGAEDIFLARSADGGKTWLKGLNLSSDDTQSSEPALAANDTAVHVVWEARADDLDVTDDRIGYAVSRDGGVSFAKAVALPSQLPLESPAVAVDGDTVHVVACSPSDKSGIIISDLWYLRSTDAGNHWDEPINLAKNAGDCSDPAVAAHGGRAYVAWSDATSGRSEILLARSDNGGRSFEAVQNVSRNAGDSQEPNLAIDPKSGTVHIVWSDYSIDPKKRD